MRLTHILLVSLTLSSASASWFGSDKHEYNDWDTAQLQGWLETHNIHVPKGYSQKELQALVKSNWDSTSSWTVDQYTKAQKYFHDATDQAIDAWDESKLREFLLEQGIVDPQGPREQLVVLAKQQYKYYSSAASSLSSSASATASTAIYGDKAHQASKSAQSVSSTLSSVAAQASHDLTRTLNDSKDYVYSTWDDNELRSYLEDKGVIKPKQELRRDELLAHMKDAYAKVSNPIYKAWSDSYVHEWLIAHGVIKSDFEKQRDALMKKMEYYYYTPQEHVWSAWSESQLKQWLVEHDIVKSDAQLKKEKMQKLVADNYASAVDTVWGSWKDSDIREWLIDHGYLRTDAQVRRDELVKLMNAKYAEVNSRTQAYLTWPDARLRAFLRNHDMPEDSLPTSRPGLLQEVRIRYVQSTSRAEQLLAAIRESINNSVEAAEEKIGRVLEILSGAGHSASKQTKKTAADASYGKDQAAIKASSAAQSLSAEAAKATKKAKAEL